VSENLRLDLPFPSPESDMQGSPLQCNIPMTTCTCNGQLSVDEAEIVCDGCPAGTYAAVPSTLNNRTTMCQSCLPGFYADISGSSGCKPHRICAPGSYEVAAGTASSDRHCGSCVAGSNFTSQVSQESASAVST
jgi:hypothetical protein